MIRNFLNFSLICIISLLFQNASSQTWKKTSGSTGEDKVQAATTDKQGNIYATGYITETVGGKNFMTQKFNPSGQLMWTAKYNGEVSGDDRAFGIVVDQQGSNVYVTGYYTNIGSNIDIATIKYSASTGNQLAIYRFGDPSNLEDKAFGIAVDRVNNVYITGYITRPGIGKDIYLAKYNSNLNFVWHASYVGTGNGEDRAFGIAVDDAGLNIYITGSTTSDSTGIDMITMCYDSSGTQIWRSNFHGEGTGEDRAFGIVVDNVTAAGNSITNGGVYITGFETDSLSGTNYMTLKYNPLNGNEIWTRKYNGPGNASDRAFGIAVDDIGDTYVTGMSTGLESGGDYLTIKYNTNGDSVWTSRYNGPGNANDSAVGIAFSKNFDRIFVTGTSPKASGAGQEDIFTIKYNTENGDSVQASRIDMPSKNSDIGIRVLADTNGNIFVTGNTFSTSNNWDWVTMKYNLGELVIGLIPISTEIPTGFSLYQNYPNPFNPDTKIVFDIAQSSGLNSNHAKLIVYDVLGREVSVLVSEQLKPGKYEVTWNAKNLVSGIYFYRLTTDNFSLTRKMILVK
jgi:hypothetical protein